MKALRRKQSFVIQAMIAIVSLWVVLMPVLPLRVVGGNIAVSVALLMRMCKIVKNIKNRDDLELQVDSFSKLNIEINKRNHIFYLTV